MVELQPSKLVVRVRFPSPAPLVRARFRRSGAEFRHVGTTRCNPSFRVVTLSSAGRVRDECGTSSGGGRGAEADEPRHLRIHEPPCPRRESATDVRLHGEEMAADADDGGAGHAFRNVHESAPGACQAPQAERPLFAAAPGQVYTEP
jgi:hypothetical protein